MAWPLPFNDALEVPVFFLFLVAVLVIGWRAWGGAERWLSERQLNVLGLLYLPIFVFDFAGSGRFQFLKPTLHLILFGITAKLASFVRERDKWHAWVGLFFLFLAAMATSVHPAALLYLVGFLGLSLTVLMRFVYLHHLTSFGYTPQHRLPPLPLGRFLAGSLIAMLLLALPLFAVLPRLRTPYVSGIPGAGLGGPESLMGFSDAMSLGGIGRLRENRAVALRIDYEGKPPVRPESLRIKMATYEKWTGRLWQRTEGIGRLLGESSGWFPLMSGSPPAPFGWAQVVLEPLETVGMPLLPGTVGFEGDFSVLALDRGGAVIRGGGPLRQPLEFRVGYDPRVSWEQWVEPPRGKKEPSLDPSGVTPRIVELSARLAGGGTVLERAERLAEKLQTEYEYALEFPAGTTGSPIEAFLFETRRGHCEYFASALVLLLRAQGIPARLVTGFYGAERSWWEKSWVVRQSSAHAWVEAWAPPLGWITLDPTPPAGLPAVGTTGVGLLMRQGYDALLFYWDRWVLSFDFEDQVSLADRLRSWFEQLRERWQKLPSWKAPGILKQGAKPEVFREPSPSVLPRTWIALGLVVLAWFALWAVWRLCLREPWRAKTGYLELRDLLRKVGFRVTDTTAPLELLAEVKKLAQPIYSRAERLIWGYLREQFSPNPPSPPELLQLRVALRELERELRILRHLRRQAVPYSSPPAHTGFISRRRAA